MIKEAIDGLVRVDGRLSLSRLALWIAAAVSAIALFFVFEDRARLIPLMLSSAWAIGIVSAVGVLGLFGTVGSYLFGKVEAKNAELQEFMRLQIVEMREEAKDDRDHSARQDVAIEALQVRDRACQDELRSVRHRMTRYEQIIARAGLDFGNTND